MERVTKTEEKVKKFREKKKILREKKRLKLKERKFQEKKEQQPKRIINNHFMGKKERKKLKKKIVKKLVKSDDGYSTTKVVKLSDLVSRYLCITLITLQLSQRSKLKY